MRSEKEQRAGSRERGSVEIQFRDCQREQDNVTVNPKHKEEKKEIFSKVNGAVVWMMMMMMMMMEGTGFSTIDSEDTRASRNEYWHQSLQTQMHSHIKTVNYPFEYI